MQFNRPASHGVDAAGAKADAKLLYDKGEGRLGTDEDVFIKILTTRSRVQTEAIGKAYADLTGHSLEKAVTAETSGTFKKALIALSKSITKSLLAIIKINNRNQIVMDL